MRGRSIGPTGRKKESIGATGPSFYKERLGTGSPPHPSPSVTASPQGEASGLCSPTRKSVPNQGTYMGTVIAPRSEQCGTTAKTSEWERAGHKPGGPGGLPPALFLPISREKWGPPPGRRAPRGAAPRGTVRAPTAQRVRSAAPRPRPGPGGNPPRRCQPAAVQKGPPTDSRGPRPHLEDPAGPNPAPVRKGPPLFRKGPQAAGRPGVLSTFAVPLLLGGSRTLTPGPRRSGGPCWPAPGRPRRSRPRRRRPPGSPSGSGGGCPRRRRG